MVLVQNIHRFVLNVHCYDGNWTRLQTNERHPHHPQWIDEITFTSLLWQYDTHEAERQRLIQCIRKSHFRTLCESCTFQSLWQRTSLSLNYDLAKMTLQVDLYELWWYYVCIRRDTGHRSLRKAPPCWQKKCVCGLVKANDMANL